MKKFFLDKIAATSPSFLPKTKKKKKKKKKNLRFVNTKMTIFVQILKAGCDPIAGSQTIADLIAICDHMETSLKRNPLS